MSNIKKVRKLSQSLQVFLSGKAGSTSTDIAVLALLETSLILVKRTNGCNNLDACNILLKTLTAVKEAEEKRVCQEGK